MAKKSYYKPKANKQSMSVKADNKRAYGMEPSFAFGQELSNVEMTRALTWYSYSVDSKVGIDFLVEYATNHPKFAKFASKLSDTFAPTYYWLARLANNGVQLAIRDINKLNAAIEDQIKKVSYKEPKRVMQSIKETNLSLAMSVIEERLDNEEDVQFKAVAAEYKLTAVELDTIYNHYRPILNELIEAAKMEDEQLKEAYAHLGKRGINKLIKLYDGILKDNNAAVAVAPVVEVVKKQYKSYYKPKGPRQPKTDGKFKFWAPQQEEASLGLVSIAPQKIVGASEVWAYNTKYKILTRFVALEGGFDVYRTGLTNVDESKSESKRCGRSLKEVLLAVKTGKKVELRKLMSTIDSEATKPSNRINNAMVVVRVV